MDHFGPRLVCSPPNTVWAMQTTVDYNNRHSQTQKYLLVAASLKQF